MRSLTAFLQSSLNQDLCFGDEDFCFVLGMARLAIESNEWLKASIGSGLFVNLFIVSSCIHRPLYRSQLAFLSFHRCGIA